MEAEIFIYFMVAQQSTLPQNIKVVSKQHDTNCFTFGCQYVKMYTIHTYLCQKHEWKRACLLSEEE